VRFHGSTENTGDENSAGLKLGVENAGGGGVIESRNYSFVYCKEPSYSYQDIMKLVRHVTRNAPSRQAVSDHRRQLLGDLSDCRGRQSSPGHTARHCRPNTNPWSTRRQPPTTLNTTTTPQRRRRPSQSPATSQLT